MKNKNFYKNHFKKVSEIFSKIDLVQLEKISNLFLKTNKSKKKVIICGNGGSSATASHVAVDLTKNANIKSITFNEYDLITCFSNDYGYEKWISKSLDFYAEKGDLLVLISCSGNSKNLVNANKVAIKKGIKVISLTGCKKNNKLNSIKSNLKIWVNSTEYNLIEIVHHMILLFIVDNLIYSRKN
jgi:D-sedoheptulose 7-phosphate isomerase